MHYSKAPDLVAARDLLKPNHVERLIETGGFLGLKLRLINRNLWPQE